MTLGLTKSEKELVSFDGFTVLLNEELCLRPWYRRDMEFVIVPGRTGYDLVGPADLEKSWMAKEVHDLVAQNYEIWR
jgi:hypothetical protein